VGVWDWNLETNDIYVDPELKALLGYRDDEIRNHMDDWGSHVHPEDGEAIIAAAQEHLEGRAPSFEVERRMIRKEGVVCWCRSGGSLIEGENGVRHIIGSDTDISETKRAELNTQFIKQLGFELSQVADADEIIRLGTSRLGEYLGASSCYIIEV